ncbi:hypothetical protein Tco_0564396 [Tanacetum coccineum]
MASMNTRLNIEKLNGNIVQKHGGSKQVRFKQLGTSVKTGVHGVSNDDTAVAKRRLKDKQPKEKTNTDCLVKEQEKEYQNGWKIKTDNVLDSFSNRSIQQWDTTRSTYLVKRSPSSAIGFKKPIDMLRVFWNMGFNESKEYKKTFIGFGVGTGSVQVLQGVEFEKVQTQDLMDYHSSRNKEQHSVCELFGYKEDSNEVAFAVAAVDKIYAHELLTFNDIVACEAEIRATKGLLDKAKGNVLGMKTVKDQSGDCDVEKNGKWSCIYAVGSQEYLMVYTRLDVASTDVGMLDKKLRSYIMALLTTEAAYMTLTEAAKEAIWLKGLTLESGFMLNIVAGIATGALSKAIPSSRFQHELKLLRIEDF